ncbi:MYCBP-associated protein-like isoform X1 [Styela clava]
MWKQAAHSAISKDRIERKNTGGLSVSSNQAQQPGDEVEDGELDTEKGKKKGAGSPDQAISPRKSGSDILNSDDIQKLSIRDEDLQKVRKSHEITSERSTKPIETSRYKVKKQKPQSEQEKQQKKVIVARTAPADAELKPIDYSGPSGPRYNHQTGEIISHSLLGSVEDFVSEAVKLNFIRPDSRSTAVLTPVQVSHKINIKPSKAQPRPKSPKIKMALNQGNALQNWQRKMADRKRQQGFISKLLQKPIDRLVMHKDDEFRKVQELRTLVDRAIPAVDYGKGYRVGSEFWRQHESFGDDLTGIKMTLTKTEKGVPIEFEHVAKPLVLQVETGIIDPTKDERTINTARQWRSSDYLEQRCRQLAPVMYELDPYNPDIANLQIIGESCDKENIPVDQDMMQEEDMVKPEQNEKYDSREVEYIDPLEKYPDVFPEPVMGPSIMFGENVASWNGSSTSHINQIGQVSRVFFESNAGERVTSHLKVHNNGTTAIYFHWRRVVTPPSFEAVKRDEIQRFYFNNGEGVVLPGETKHFPFVFKSPNPGIFTETWQLLTEPVVMGGASLHVVLKGIATEDDVNFEIRNEILKELKSKEAEVAARSIIEEIIKSIRESDRPPSPTDAYITEEQLFKRKNPSSQYDYETILELKNFYLQLFPEESRPDREWDLSLDELKDCIVAVPDENAKEELLNGLGTVIGRLGSKPFTPTQNLMYAACYQRLQDTIDGICSSSMRIRSIMGLPEIVMEPVVEVDASVYSARSINSGSSAGNSRRTTADDKKGAKGGKKPPAKEDPKAKGKGGKKDAKEKDRPKSKDVKGGKGKGTPAAGATPTKEIPSVERDIAVKTPSSTKTAPVDTMDQETRKKYTEKMYSQVYNILCETLDDMSEVFYEIKKTVAHD